MNQVVPYLSESYPQSIYLKNVIRSLRTIDTLRTTQGRRANFKRFVNAVYGELGILLLAYSGQRTYDQQWKLRLAYLGGGARAAAPGYSWHPYGRAIDTVPLNSDGTANWKSRDWGAIHRIADRFGLNNGRAYGDAGHISDQRGTTLASQRQQYPGWEQYVTEEKAAGITKPKQLKDPRNFNVSRGLLTAGVLTVAFFGGRYLYRRYAQAS